MSKRLFDLFFSFLAIISLSGILLICILIASVNTKSLGLFIQIRIGQHGIPFKIYKIKSLVDSTKRVTAFGRFLRASKFDELPQLFNVLNGTMSFVGPRPDMAGFADCLVDADRIILTAKPGITGLASIKYRNEEALLQQEKNPMLFNQNVIWPDKVRINKWYVQNRTIWLDILVLFYTIVPGKFNVDRFIEGYVKPNRE